MIITKPLSNLHTHTTFSDGRASVQSNIEKAIECGFASLGISDHSHNTLDPGTMKPGREAEYISHIRTLAEEYKGRIDVFAGIELDSFSSIDTDAFDYVIASVHFIKIGDVYEPVDWSIDVQKSIAEKYFGGCEIGFVKAYYDELVRHVKATKPDIVGHFDLLTKFGTIDEASEEYRRISLDALHKVMDVCTRFEVNTGAIARGYKQAFYPPMFILREIHRLGGTVTVTSDCHDGVQLDCAFVEALEEIKKAGFTHIDRLTPDGFIQDKIEI